MFPEKEMASEMQCVTISFGEIEKYRSVQELMGLAGDEIFLIDMDAIKRGKPNFKFYQEISKYFDINVLSLISRVDDLVDSLILGCQSVVISPALSPRKISEFLEVSENIVMPYTSLPSTREFSRLGGTYFLSNTLVNYNFNLCYYYGPGDPGEKYVRLKDFPLETSIFSLE